MAQQGKKKTPANPPDDDDDDGDGDDALTEGQTKHVLKLVNSALSGQLNRKLGPAVKAELAPVLEQLQKLAPGGKKDDDQDDDEDDDDDAPPAGKNKGKGKPDPALTKMTKQMNDLQRQLKERDDKLVKEADARKTSKIESTLTQALTELGVDKNRIRGALAIHKGTAHVDDESGNVLFKMKRDGYDEDLEPAAALKEWASTDEGKSYIAPTGSSGGSGARPPRNPGPGRKPAANTPEAKAEKVAAAKTDLISAVGQLVAGGSIAIE